MVPHRSHCWWLCLAFVWYLCVIATANEQVLAEQSLPAVPKVEESKILHKLQPIDFASSPDVPSGLHLQSPPQSPPDRSARLQVSSHDLRDLHRALFTLQDKYFSLWLGKWTTAIDWTAAVLGTYLSATLLTLSSSFASSGSSPSYVENELNKYFAQSQASYYGEEAFAIRMQAYDDMLWVVLEWLESIKFIQSRLLYHDQSNWHGKQFTPVFAHRARVFYELAEKGWDWRLCGGGMTWNPRLLPYKNAITNQLFISASINMYLHFPGDHNCSPFSTAEENAAHNLIGLHPEELGDCGDDNRGQYDPYFRQKAIEGYEWLKNSGMINGQGLYTDGFHIRDYSKNKSATTCDERNDMVYTYNQGVILSGLRGLWEATGNTTYLKHGHHLISSVQRATGWPSKSESEHDESDSDTSTEWHGLGTNGILTELCDPSGSCNQDGQSFKGIFFHHLTAFCEPLPLHPVKPGRTFAATKERAFKHRQSCDEIAKWVRHNAQAALRTRDSEGRFGSWWGAPHESHKSSSFSRTPIVVLPQHAIDYRNMPNLLYRVGIDPENPGVQEKSARPEVGNKEAHMYRQAKLAESGDLNDRGRGRTVETQGSGLSVVRAMFVFTRRSSARKI